MWIIGETMCDSVSGLSFLIPRIALPSLQICRVSLFHRSKAEIQSW
nr:hypothetical protein [uncultured Porphyromonas sp.]